jgi:hypothetical protein
VIFSILLRVSSCNISCKINQDPTVSKTALYLVIRITKAISPGSDIYDFYAWAGVLSGVIPTVSKAKEETSEVSSAAADLQLNPGDRQILI